MIRACRRDIVCLLIVSLLLAFRIAQAQSPAVAQPHAKPDSGPLQAAAITARKVAIQQQLATLA